MWLVEVRRDLPGEGRAAAAETGTAATTPSPADRGPRRGQSGHATDVVCHDDSLLGARQRQPTGSSRVAASARSRPPPSHHTAWRRTRVSAATAEVWVRGAATSWAAAGSWPTAAAVGGAAGRECDGPAEARPGRPDGRGGDGHGHRRRDDRVLDRLLGRLRRSGSARAPRRRVERDGERQRHLERIGRRAAGAPRRRRCRAGPCSRRSSAGTSRHVVAGDLADPVDATPRYAGRRGQPALVDRSTSGRSASVTGAAGRPAPTGCGSSTEEA